MKRRVAAGAIALAAFALSGGAAVAAGSASPNASCVAAVTSYEATQLQPGSVGSEVSGLATSAPRAAGNIVSDLAKGHGSIGACL